MRIVILGAFQDELFHIKNQFPTFKEIMISKCCCLLGKWNHHDVLISLSGIGTNASAITTTILCENFYPDLIIFCGVAGGLKPHQQIGDLILGNQIIDADLYQLPVLLNETPYQGALFNPHTKKFITCNYSLNPHLSALLQSFSFERLNLGTIVTSNTFPAPKTLFSEIKAWNCSAIEMESTGAFKAAEYYDVPIITLRAISNLLDDQGNDLGTKPDALNICAQNLSDCLMALLSHINKYEYWTENETQSEIKAIIEKYALISHPEGGWYRRMYQSDDYVIAQAHASDRYQGETRLACTSILYLLPQDDFSAWHTVQSDETWCFHQGAPLLLREINLNGELHEILLSSHEGYLQYTIKAGLAFSAQSLGGYSLISCIVAPGFEFKDFKLLSQKEFIHHYPQHASLARLTRF